MKVRILVSIMLAAALVFSGTAMAAGGYGQGKGNGNGNVYGNGYGQGQGNMGSMMGNGKGGGKGNGGGYATSPATCSTILAGTATTIQGNVSGIGSASAQNSLTVSTTGGDIEVYGLGPSMHWGAAYPEVGDYVTIEARSLNFNGTNKNIIMGITYEDGAKVQLRDAVTGCPLWRAGNIK